MTKQEILAQIEANKQTARTTPQIAGLMKAENVNLVRKLTKLEEA